MQKNKTKIKKLTPVQTKLRSYIGKMGKCAVCRGLEMMGTQRAKS